MPIYRRSQAQQTKTVLRTWNTVTVIAAYGSEDGYTAPKTEFADDETIMVAGSVIAGNNGDLTGVQVEIFVNGVFAGTVPLYGYDGANNFYQANIGMLPEGTHVIEAVFPRTRK